MKREPIKKLLPYVCIFCAVLVVIIVLAWAICDRSDAAALVTAVSSPALVIIGFYCWKAKCENVLKLQKKGLKITMEDMDDGNY